MIAREIVTLLSFKGDNRQLEKAERDLERFARNASALLAGVGAALAGAFGVQKLIQAGDAYTTTMNRLGAATSTVGEATQAYEGLYASARETGIAVQESSKAFMRFSPAMQRLGYNITDTIALVDGLQKGLLAAGATAQESSSVFQQLGQAINSGVFQGEELGSFLENASPTLVAKFAEALGTTADKLKEMGSSGKLVTTNVLPALIAAARAGRDEFGKMRVTVELAMARSNIALDRFLAEFDRALRLTEILSGAIEAVGKKIDQWRSYLPGVTRLVNELGGLERILGTLALGIAAVTGATLVLNGALSGLLIRAAVIAAPFLAIAGAIAIAGASLQDFWLWVRGGGTKTVLGDLFGPFDQLVAPLKPALDQVNKILTGTPDEVIAAWDRLKEYFRNWAGDAFKNFPPFVQRWMGIEPTLPPQNLDEYQERAGQLNRERVTDPAANWFTSWMRDILGAIGVPQRVQRPDGTLELLPPGQNMNEFLRRQPASMTQNNSATVTNNVTVNATGVSGAEVASATQQGMNHVLSQAHWFEKLAREAAMANPAYEGRAMGSGQ